MRRLGDNHNKCRLLGANLMPMLGLALVQKGQDDEINKQRETGKNIYVIGNNIDAPAEWAGTQYPNLFSRTGRLNNHTVKTKFRTPFIARQQKGRRIPLAIQEHVAAEIERLIKEGT